MTYRQSFLPQRGREVLESKGAETVCKFRALARTRALVLPEDIFISLIVYVSCYRAQICYGQSPMKARRLRWLNVLSNHQHHPAAFGSSIRLWAANETREASHFHTLCERPTECRKSKLNSFFFSTSSSFSRTVSISVSD